MNFSIPNGLALDAEGHVFVTDYGMGSIFRVNPVSGDRVVYSGCVDPACSSSVGSGPSFALPWGIVVVPEPGQTLSMLASLGALGLLARRRLRCKPV